MANADLSAERRGAPAVGDERDPLDGERPRLEVLAPAQLDRVRQRVDPADVAWLAIAECHPQAASLAHRVGGGAAMLPHSLAVEVDDRPRRLLPTGPVAERIAVVAAGHEADLLALGLVGGHEPELAGDRTDLRLRQLAEREPGVLELVLAEAVEEVGLVLVLVAGSRQPRDAVVVDDPPRVVPGRDRVAVVEMARPAEQRPELHVRVAVDARAGRRAAEIRVEERLHHAGVELALEVHDVERDAQLGGDPPRVVGRVERAAALLELGIGVGDVVEAHPDAHRVMPFSLHQCRGNGGVHAPRHRDEDSGHTPTPWPSGSAATAADPTRIEATTRGTTSAAKSTSASVVVLPSDRRSAPRASSSG